MEILRWYYDLRTLETAGNVLYLGQAPAEQKEGLRKNLYWSYGKTLGLNVSSDQNETIILLKFSRNRSIYEYAALSL